MCNNKRFVTWTLHTKNAFDCHRNDIIYYAFHRGRDSHNNNPCAYIIILLLYYYLYTPRHIVSVQLYVNIVQQTCRPLTIIIINEFSAWSCFERGSNARRFLFRKIKFKVYALRGGGIKKKKSPVYPKKSWHNIVTRLGSQIRYLFVLRICIKAAGVPKFIASIALTIFHYIIHLQNC